MSDTESLPLVSEVRLGEVIARIKYALDEDLTVEDLARHCTLADAVRLREQLSDVIYEAGLSLPR
jgi:hypothetical protein